jgi:hypothetical protein
LPASILEKSRMSLMMVSRLSAELFRVETYSRWRAVERVFSSSPLIPRMPCIGVRISWLTLATNSDLACAICNAACRAASWAASVARRSVTSRMIAWITGLPSSSIACRAISAEKTGTVLAAGKPVHHGMSLSAFGLARCARIAWSKAVTAVGLDRRAELRNRGAQEGRPNPCRTSIPWPDCSR